MQSLEIDADEPSIASDVEAVKNILTHEQLKDEKRITGIVIQWRMSVQDCFGDEGA